MKNVPTNFSDLKSKVDKLDVGKLVPVNAKINKVKKQIPSITNLATTKALNAKINEVKNKILNTTNLATTTAFTAVQNKILNVSNLVKKYWL